MTDPFSIDADNSTISPYAQRQEVAPARTQQVQEKLEETSGIQAMEQLKPSRISELQGFYNTTLDRIEQIRSGEFPDLEKIKKSDGADKKDPKQAKEEQDKEEEMQAEAQEEAKRAQAEEDAQKAQQEEEAKKAKEEEEKKKKAKQIGLSANFTPMADKGEIVSPGKTVCQLEGIVTGPDADKLSQEEKEALKEIAKRKAQGQVAAGSGMPLGIEDDGTLTAPSLMKITSIADSGELSGQKPLAARGLEESKPFESSLADGEGKELEKAQQYLQDNPGAPDANEVKARIDKLEKKEGTQAPGTRTSDAAESSDDENEKKTGQESVAQNTQGSQGPPKVGNTGETEKSQETKDKKKRDITIETIFTPLVRAGDIVMPGRNIGHFEINLTGKDADKLDIGKREEIKQEAMQLVEKGSGRTMGIPKDGNLPADSMMKIGFVASSGKLESGQKVLSVQSLDGRNPFESYMKEEGGNELEKAKQYLRDNPDAPDADEVKKRIDKLEKERASGIDFSLKPNEEDQEEGGEDKTRQA